MNGKDDEAATQADANAPQHQSATAQQAALYRAELGTRLARQRKSARIAFWIAAGSVATLVVAILLLGSSSDFAGLATIIAAIAGMAWSRFCVNAEATERAIAETAMTDTDPDRTPADDRRLRLIHTQRSLNLTRTRALSSLAYAIIFMALGLFALIFFAASVPDFIAQYNALHFAEDGTRLSPAPRDAAWIEGYELQLLGYGITGTALLGWGLAQLVTARNSQREAERLEVERELMRFRTTEESELARKLFLLNGQGLDKYYDINRLNNRLAMVLSLVCIAIGVGITIWTVRLVIATDPAQGQVIIAAVGAANTIMVHVVAAIVLRMQGTIWANVDTFHQRLVRTHELFLANVIAADLDTPEARRHSQAVLAEAIGNQVTSGHNKKPEK